MKIWMMSITACRHKRLFQAIRGRQASMIALYLREWVYSDISDRGMVYLIKLISNFLLELQKHLRLIQLDPRYLISLCSAMFGALAKMSQVATSRVDKVFHHRVPLLHSSIYLRRTTFNSSEVLLTWTMILPLMLQFLLLFRVRARNRIKRSLFHSHQLR